MPNLNSPLVSPQSGESLSSTELYLTSTGEFVPYVDLPLAMNSHNVMRVNDTHAALTQGSEDQGVFLLDRSVVVSDWISWLNNCKR